MVKSLVLPHFLQLVSVSTLSSNLLSHLEKLIIDFVWNNKQHLVSKSTLIRPIELGGMKMISIREFAKSAQIMLIKRFCSQVDAKRKHLLEYLMGSYRGHCGRVVTLSPPTSEAGVRFTARPQVGKLHGSYLPLVGSLQYITLTNCMYWFPLPFQLPVMI